MWLEVSRVALGRGHNERRGESSRPFWLEVGCHTIVRRIFSVGAVYKCTLTTSPALYI